MTKENNQLKTFYEFRQLSELSVDTLKRYKKAAQSDRSQAKRDKQNANSQLGSDQNEKSREKTRVGNDNRKINAKKHQDKMKDIETSIARNTKNKSDAEARGKRRLRGIKMANKRLGANR